VLSLVAQVNALQESNKQLYKELQETKAELETLKQSWQKLPPEYEPGMLSGAFSVLLILLL
jgi:cell division protein FtsB